MSENTPHLPVVLVIDDEIQMRRLLRVTLEGNGYRVFEAASGQARSGVRGAPLWPFSFRISRASTARRCAGSTACGSSNAPASAPAPAGAPAQ